MTKVLIALFFAALLNYSANACFGGGGFSVGISTSGGPFVGIHDGYGRSSTIDRDSIRRQYDDPPPPTFYSAKDLTTSDDGIEFIKEREGFEERVYPDHVRRQPTVGYGTNCKSNPQICQEMIPESGIVDRNLAEQMMKRELQFVERIIKNNVKVPITQNQYDALASFIYQAGAGNFQTSTLLRKLNEGDTQAAAEAFKLFNKLTDPDTGEKKPSKGLNNRRQLEVDLFCKGGECDPSKGKPAE